MSDLKPNQADLSEGFNPEEFSANERLRKQTQWVMALLLPVIFLTGFTFLKLTGNNTMVFIWLNDLMHDMPVTFWANMTFLADSAAVLALASIFLLRKERLVFAALIGGIACGIVIRILKVGFDMPRPPAVLNGSLFETIGEAYRSKSFPSGHAATALFTSGVVIAFWHNKTVYVLALMFGLLGALSRVAAGVHWPEDILVGGAIGWFIGYSAGLIFRNRAYFSYPKRIFVFAFSYIAAVFLLAYDPNMPHVMWAQGIIAAVGLYCSLYYLAFRILKV